MGITYNKAPISINQPDVNYKFFNHNQWNGVSDTKNFLAADQFTFEDCQNVYMNDDGLLRSRPSTKFINGASNIVNVWTFPNCVVYETYIDNIYALNFKRNNETTIIKKELAESDVKLILADEKIFIFTSSSLMYYDNRNNVDVRLYINADEYIYKPILKRYVDGVLDETVENENVLTSSYRIEYIYSNITTADIGPLLDNVLTIVIDKQEVSVTFTEDTKYVLVDHYSNISDANYSGENGPLGKNMNDMPMISISEHGSFITYFFKDDRCIIQYSVDGKTFITLPTLTHTISTPWLSNDGTFVAVLGTNVVEQDGSIFADIMVISVAEEKSDDGSSIDKRFPVWTKLSTYLHTDIISISMGQWKIFTPINAWFDTFDNFHIVFMFGQITIIDCISGTVTRNNISIYDLFKNDITVFRSTYLQETANVPLNGNYISYYTYYDINTSTTPLTHIDEYELLTNDHYDYYKLIITSYITDEYESITNIVHIKLEAYQLGVKRAVAVGVTGFDNPNEELSEVRIDLFAETDGVSRPSVGYITLHNVFSGTFNDDYLYKYEGRWFARSNMTPSSKITYDITTVSLSLMPFEYAISSNYRPNVGAPNTRSFCISGTNALNNISAMYFLHTIDIAGEHKYQVKKTLLDLPNYLAACKFGVTETSFFYIDVTNNSLIRISYDTNESTETIISTISNIETFRIIARDKYNILTNEFLLKQGKRINLLFSAIPVEYILSNDYIFVALNNTLYSNYMLDKLVFTQTINDENHYFLPSFVTELNTFYLTKDNILYQAQYPSQERFAWWLPKNSIETFDSNITNIHPISKTELAVFFDDSIYYVSDTEIYKSKIGIGLKEGSDVITTFDGTNTIFATQRGLVAMSYQDFVASTEQSLKYLSDTISKRFTEFNNNAIKLYQYKFWIVCYKLNDTLAYVLDLRNLSWWPMKYSTKLLNIFTIDKPYVLCDNMKIYSLDTTSNNYKDDNNNNFIEWFIKSQKLHLGAINYNKHIINLGLSSVAENETCNAILQIKNYRKTADNGRDEILDYDVNVIRNYIKRLNYSKVNEFQYTLKNDLDNLEQYPLTLSNISIKYTITGAIK